MRKMVTVINALTGDRQRVWFPGGDSGIFVPVERAVHNPPVEYLMPGAIDNEDIVIIDWDELWQKVHDDLAAEHAEAQQNAVRGTKVRLPPFEEELARRLEECLDKGVQYAGRTYHAWGWGSGAKERQTLGMVEDWPLEKGLVQYVEQRAYLARMLVPNGMYGGGEKTLRIKYVKSGTMVGKYMVADGMCLVKREAIESLVDQSAGEVCYGSGGNCSQPWQMFEPNDDFVRDVMIGHKEMVKGLEDNPSEVVASLGELGDYQRSLVAANPDMVKHPMFANSVAGDAARTLATVAQTVYCPTRVKVVFPSPDGDWWMDTLSEGHHLVARYPVDAKTNVQAVDVKHDERWHRLKQLVSGTYGLQYTCVDRSFRTDKGNMWAVDDLDGDLDAVFCVDNIKLAGRGRDLAKLREELLSSGVVEETLFFSFLQKFAGESIALAPVALWLIMGGDYDGDLLIAFVVELLHEIWRQALEWSGLGPFDPNRKKGYRATESYKIAKTYTFDHSLTWKFLLQAWVNNIGFVTNLYALTWALPWTKRLQVAQWVYEDVPELFQFAEKEIQREGISVRMLDWVMNRLFKEAQDAFKKSVNTQLSLKTMRRIQTGLSKRLGGMVPFPLWTKGTVAFRTALPMLRSELDPNYVAAVTAATDEARQYRQREEWRMHMSDEHAGATLAQIYLAKRPWFQKEMAKMFRKEKFSLLSAMEPYILSDWESMAPPVALQLVERAREIVAEYNKLSRRVDHKNERQKENLRTFIQGEVERYLGIYFDDNRTVMSYALWRASHHSSSELASAMCVFDAMPNEALRIAKYQPGRVSGPTYECLANENASEVARWFGCSVDEIVDINGRSKFAPGDIVRLPKFSYQFNEMGARFNFTSVPAVVGPFVGSVSSVHYRGSTRLVITTKEPLPNHVGSSLGSDIVCMIPDILMENVLEGDSSPPPGDYLITMRLMKESGVRKVLCTPI